MVLFSGKQIQEAGGAVPGCPIAGCRVHRRACRAFLLQNLEGLVEGFVGRLHAQTGVEHEQGLAHGLDDILGIKLGVQGALLGFLIGVTSGT